MDAQVLCTAFRAKADAYPNLTVKKIPKQELSRCEWGHDDYSLQVENLPKAPLSPGPSPAGGRGEKFAGAAGSVWQRGGLMSAPVNLIAERFSDAGRRKSTPLRGEHA